MQRRFHAVLWPLVIALSGWAFGGALALPLTDTDALADVACAARPLWEQPFLLLTCGVGGDNANFWRPAVMLQFWLLRRLFGWDAWGYHAWDIGLHILASGLVGVLVRDWTRLGGREDRPLAWLTAALFCAHPLAVEVVPAVARSIDLLLAVGCLTALIGLARAHRGLWWGGLVLGLLSKEAAVLLLPVGGMVHFLYSTKPSYRERLLDALRSLAPAILLVLLWFGARSVMLSGVGGYYEAEDLGGGNRMSYALDRGFIEPWLTPLSGVLEGWRGVPGSLLTFALLALLLGEVWRSPHRRFLAVMFLFFASFILLFGATGTYSRRVLYVPTLFAALILSSGLLRRGWTLPAWLGLLGVWLYGSPALWRYDDWAASGRVATLFMDPALYADVPDGTTLYMVDRPIRFNLDPRRNRLWSKRGSLNHATTSYAIESWVDEHFPSKNLSIRRTSNYGVRPGDATATLTVQGRSLLIQRAVGHRDPLESPHYAWVESTDTDARLDWLDPAPAWLLVWNPDRVERVVLPPVGE